MLNVQRHEYPRWLRLAFGAAAIASSAITLFAVLATIVRLFQDQLLLNQPALLVPMLCILTVVVGALTLFQLALLISTVTLLPAISVSETGIKVHSLIAESRWLPWESIRKVRHPPFSFRRSYQVGMEGLPAIFKVHGLIWRLGAGGFMITPGIGGFDDLMRKLRNERPDLFVKKI